MKPLRGDDSALSTWIIVTAILVVVAVVVVAYVVLAEPSDYMNQPDEDTKWTLDVTYKFKFRNLPGGWSAPESDKVFRVEVSDYDHDKNYNKYDLFGPGSALDTMWFQKENEFRFILELKITGPNQFSEKEEWVQDIDIGEFSKQSVSFGTKYVFLEHPGRYTVKATLSVKASKEHAWLDEVDGVIWSDTKMKEVGP